MKKGHERGLTDTIIGLSVLLDQIIDQQSKWFAFCWEGLNI